MDTKSLNTTYNHSKHNEQKALPRPCSWSWLGLKMYVFLTLEIKNLSVDNECIKIISECINTQTTIYGMNDVLHVHIWAPSLAQFRIQAVIHRMD